MALKKNMEKLLIPFRHNARSLSGINKKGIVWQTHDINNVLSSAPPIISFSQDEEDYAKKFYLIIDLKMIRSSYLP